MAQIAIRRLVSMFVLAVIAVASCLAQDRSSLVGRWNMTSESSADPVRWVLVVKEADGKLVGLLATDEGEQPAKDFTYQGGVVKFKAPYQDQDYDIELKLKGSTLEGTWSGGGDSGRTSGTKAS